MNSKPLRLSFPATRRLKSNREFERVRQEGKRIHGKFFSLGILRGVGETGWRAGFVTSRKVGGAVIRNRVRRRLREIVRRHQHQIAGDVWLVLIGRTAAAQASFEKLEDEWWRLMQRAGALKT